MMGRLLLLLAVILLSACSGASAAPPPPAPGPRGGPAPPRPGGAAGAAAPSQTPGAIQTLPADSAGGSGAPVAGTSGGPLPLPSGFRPSGAQVRVANLYRSIGSTGAPGAIDVYGDYGADGTPLAIVPYGTISDWFDPGILDDARNAEMTFYPHGAQGSDSEIASQGETLKGTERITIVMTASDNKNASGQSFGMWQMVFETSTVNPLPTPPADQAEVLLVTLALPEIPGVTADYVYMGAGGDCLRSVGGGDGPQPIAANRVTTGLMPFVIPTGPHTLTFHLDAADCRGKGVLDDIPVQLAAGQRTFVLLYSPDGSVVRSLLVPVEP